MKNNLSECKIYEEGFRFYRLEEWFRVKKEDTEHVACDG